MYLLTPTRQRCKHPVFNVVIIFSLILLSSKKCQHFRSKDRSHIVPMKPSSVCWTKQRSQPREFNTIMSLVSASCVPPPDYVHLWLNYVQVLLTIGSFHFNFILISCEHTSNTQNFLSMQKLFVKQKGRKLFWYIE